MEDDKIRCPYCNSKRTKIIGGNYRETYRSYISEVEYICLDNEDHRFKCCKYTRMPKEEK